MQITQSNLQQATKTASCIACPTFQPLSSEFEAPFSAYFLLENRVVLLSLTEWLDLYKDASVNALYNNFGFYTKVQLF